MALQEREAYILQILRDSVGDKDLLGPEVTTAVGAQLQGTTVKRNKVRITVILAGGSSSETDYGYTDRDYLYNYNIHIQSNNRSKLLQVMDVVLNRLNRFNLMWTLAEETYDNSLGHSLMVSI